MPRRGPLEILGVEYIKASGTAPGSVRNKKRIRIVLVESSLLPSQKESRREEQVLPSMGALASCAPRHSIWQAMRRHRAEGEKRAVTGSTQQEDRGNVK